MRKQATRPVRRHSRGGLLAAVLVTVALAFAGCTNGNGANGGATQAPAAPAGPGY